MILIIAHVLTNFKNNIKMKTNNITSKKCNTELTDIEKRLGINETCKGLKRKGNGV